MAGSKPGERRGGRRKGTPNRKTAEQTAMIQSLMGDEDGDPFIIVMKAIKNPADYGLAQRDRVKLCLEVLPYFRPKLASIEQRTATKTHEERLAEMQALLA